MMSEKQIDKIIGYPNHFYDKTLKKIIIETTNQLHNYNKNELDKFMVQDGVIKFCKVPDDYMTGTYEEIYINIEDINSIRLVYEYNK